MNDIFNENLFLMEVEKYSKGIESGNSKAANKAHNTLHKQYALLKKRNMLHLYLDFIKNEKEYVRLWAAIFLLTRHEEIATNVLQEISTDKSIIGLTAKHSLILWREGQMDML